MKVMTIVGARPQFIKAAPVSKALRQVGIGEYLVHTGQHYDYAMSEIFFEELQIAKPDINLEIGSGSHGLQTGRMLIKLEEVMIQQKPDIVLVYGDTNSTLAGALSAVKLALSVAHIEAGLRSFNREMPEEINRILTDHCATLLFCPTQNAVDLLAKESITQNVHLVGDTMYDAVLQFIKFAEARTTVLETLGLRPQHYLLATVHRPYNTDRPENLRNLIEAFLEVDMPVVFPVHPRTRRKILDLGDLPDLSRHPQLKMIEPVGYLDMLVLQKNAQAVLTDSGGMQKEAYFLGVPCVTLRPETEWAETLSAGWNVLVGADKTKILAGVRQPAPSVMPPPVFGNGHAAAKIVTILEQT